MTQHSKRKIVYLQLNELKPRIKNGTEATLNLSSNVIGNSNDETNFPHRLLLQGCQWTLKTLKTLKSLENEMVTLNDLEMLKYQERTLKSIDFYFFPNLENLEKLNLSFIITEL